MTKVEKLRFINAYCDRHTHNCNSCPLATNDWNVLFPGKKCLYVSISPEEDLDRAIEIIKGESVEPKVAEKAEDKKDDPVNHPAHYTDGKIEVIKYIKDKKLGFCLGNAIKYISRAGKKDPTKTVEDLRKAIWYIEEHIKDIEEVG